jgi:hypothetical protein
MALVVVCLCGCEKPVIPTDDIPSGDDDGVRPEVLIAENDTARFYLSGVEYSGITLTAYPTPQTLIADPRYRMPTKLEVSGTLKAVVPPSGYWQSKQRILCYDTTTGIYYTYIPGGTVTRAGYKTQYCILPIRAERKSKDGNTEINITINDQWND